MLRRENLIAAQHSHGALWGRRNLDETSTHPKCVPSRNSTECPSRVCVRPFNKISSWVSKFLDLGKLSLWNLYIKFLERNVKSCIPVVLKNLHTRRGVLVRLPIGGHQSLSGDIRDVSRVSEWPMAHTGI